MQYHLVCISTWMGIPLSKWLATMGVTQQNVGDRYAFIIRLVTRMHIQVWNVGRWSEISNCLYMGKPIHESYDHPIPIFVIILSLRWLWSHHPGITITTINQGDFQGSGDCMSPKICSAVCQLLLLAVSRAPNARTSSVQASKHRGLWIKPWEIVDLTMKNDDFMRFNHDISSKSVS